MKIPRVAILAMNPLRRLNMSLRHSRNLAPWLCVAAVFLLASGLSAQPYLDNETQYSNQDPATETRRSDHFRLCFGHYNRDTGTPMTEALVQGNLQMYEQMWNRWVNEMGLHDINESATKPDGNKYRANFNFLMTWNDGGGGGAYSSMDGNGFFYAMANSGYCRFDPPSGATPHEFGHAWEGSCAGFNGSDSSGAWWECTANWMQLQFLNTYPQPGAMLYNPMYYPAHGRDYYDTYMIWEAAREDSRYGAAWVNNIWTNANADQQKSEFIIDRMIRCDTSGSPDKAGAVKDLWGDMAKKCVTLDYERQRWLASAIQPDDGSNWDFYQRCRTPLVRMPGIAGWYRPERSHLPMQFGFNVIPLQATPGTTAYCDFEPDCDPVRQSDWRACLVAVSGNGDAHYSRLWSKGTNSILLGSDDSKLYLVVIATPKPMKIPDPTWAAYVSDAGLQFPYRVSFAGTAPKNVIYPVQNRSGMHQHPNGLGWVANTATVDSTAYVGPNAQVLNGAQIRGFARIEDYAVVKNSAQVRDNAVVSGHALVEGNAQIFGEAKVRDWGHVFGYAEVYEKAKVIEHANCGDGDAGTHTTVFGNAVVKGTTYVYNPSTFSGSLIVDGDSANGGTGDHGVHFGWAWGQDTARFNSLPDNHFLYASHNFEKDNAVFALDQYGINHGFLMNGCRVAKDTTSPARGGFVLPLDGVSQYVELHNSINDFSETAICVWVKWSGSGSDQRIWSMGDGGAKEMYLTPRDAATGRLRLVSVDETTGTREYLDGDAPLPTDAWTHVAVVFSGTTSTLYVNGMPLAANAAATLRPDSLNAPSMENANYLGRNNAGNFFQGSLDDFQVYVRALTPEEVYAVYSAPEPPEVSVADDTTAPTPNAATWLVNPRALGDDAVTMTATAGTDDSGWVEYYFACTAGGGHDSGWVSFNKYTDVGLTAGTTYAYTVRMRDRAGNITSPSAPGTATTAVSSVSQASFAYGPVGISPTAITMTAARTDNASGQTQYLFSRSGKSSGWQSSPTWTDTGLGSGSTLTYTVQMRDGRGHVGSASVPVSAMAKDQAAPILPRSYAQWNMLPYATIDNRISMTAQVPVTTDATGIQYFFHCTSGGAPDSAWQDSSTYVTPAQPDGSYTFQYKVRDKAGTNESGYSTTYRATVKPTTGYHSYTLSQVLTNPDDYLVSFPATVMKVETGSYYVKDLVTGTSIDVKPNTYAETTDASLALKNVNVKGHLYTLNGSRIVTYATLTATGNPDTYAISGKVTNSAGVPVPGATVYFSDVTNAPLNSIVSTTTDANGNYTRGVTPGTWFVAVASSAYNTSADRSVVVTTAGVANVDFVLVANARILGQVTRRTDGTPVPGAIVYFSKSAGASGNPVFTTTTDATGAYAQAVQDGIWYVAAEATGFYAAADKMVTVNQSDVPGIDFALKGSERNIPRSSDLLFSVVTDALPASGNTGPWATYQPAGQTLSTIGSPTAEVPDGVKWEKNAYADGDGYKQGRYATPIACNGMTILAAIQPTFAAVPGEPRGEIVDIFYDRLALSISHADGRVMVARNYWNDWGPAIPNGQKTVLTLVVQPDGSYKTYANGSQIMTGGANGDWTSINPDHSASWGNDPDFTHYVSVGRNYPDGWSTFNGHLGDVFVYTIALTDAERRQLEADVSAKFLSTDYKITASAGTGGYINPGGTILVNPGGAQTFTIAPLAGYALTNVVVDGVSRGAINSYAFTNILANHSISAQFGVVPTTPPTLQIARTVAGNIEITWPDNYSGQLLRSSTLGAGASWTPVPGTPAHSGGIYKYTITPGPGAEFYGLSQ